MEQAGERAHLHFQHAHVGAHALGLLAGGDLGVGGSGADGILHAADRLLALD
ncbi:hypothetical protein [Xanthomonas axonopodis]|uniref:hypothetical protein n=1 Tax=Xanthomonas axonopodis TaxID=53413 RepID=UPI0013CF08BC|nr:hypothetical protein [Xanthomonas axonopodis]